MIKTEFFDEKYNEVDPDDAKLIVQLFLDNSGTVQKRVEWVPKKKSGFSNSISQINNNVDYEHVSQSVISRYTEIVSDTQQIISHLWTYHKEVPEIMNKAKILDTLSHSYEQLRWALNILDHELDRKKKRGNY